MEYGNNNIDDKEEHEIASNPYLALRAAKIARNQARLKELGLVKFEPSCSNLPKSRIRSIKSNSNAGGCDEQPRASVRRSQRLRQDEINDAQQPKRKKPSATSDIVAPLQEESKPPVPYSSIGSLSKNNNIIKPLHPRSVRNMSIHVNDLVLGNTEYPKGILGQRMAFSGKAYCMEISAKRSGVENYEGLSFNKYSGIQEWKNDALFLWVNVGGGNDVMNEFLEGGRKMTWYGGSRHHEGTSIILRLLQVGQQAAQGNLPDENGIVLWCREYVAAERAWSPYICLGRLAYHSHERGSHPLRFIMSLLDFERLNQHADLTLRQMFHHKHL